MPNEHLMLTSGHDQQYAVALGSMSVDFDITLQRVETYDDRIIYDAIENDRAFLARTLDWVRAYRPEQARSDNFHQMEESRQGLRAPYKIIYQGEFAGLTSLHSRHEKQAYKGYWLVKNQLGKGIATRAAAGLRDYGLSQWGLESIYLHIKPRNQPSRRVAMRLGATVIGSTRNADSGVFQKYEVWRLDKDAVGR